MEKTARIRIEILNQDRMRYVVLVNGQTIANFSLYKIADSYVVAIMKSFSIVGIPTERGGVKQ